MEVLKLEKLLEKVSLQEEKKDRLRELFELYKEYHSSDDETKELFEETINSFLEKKFYYRRYYNFRRHESGTKHFADAFKRCKEEY